MASFIRTIPHSERSDYVEEILGRSDHQIPLKFKPTRSQPGDFIYLAYHGGIVARALISEIVPYSGAVPVSSGQTRFDAKFLVRYQNGWQKPPKPISFKGAQGIRYLDRLGLEGIDAENW